MKHITGSKTIIEDIRRGRSRLEYRVAAGGCLTVVFLCRKQGDADVSVTVRLAGEGASAVITGIVIGKGESRVNISTMQIHEAADTVSDLLVKSVLVDHAACLYDGGIRVEKKAQKTNAYQRNENLLLSDHVYAQSKPALEILANDVRCTHGATAGPIDDEEVWYLATRGIPKDEAEHLITLGFITSALERVEDERVKEQLLQVLADAI